MAGVEFQPTQEDEDKLGATLSLMTASGRDSFLELYHKDFSELKLPKKTPSDELKAIHLVVIHHDTQKEIKAFEGHHLQNFISDQFEKDGGKRKRFSKKLTKPALLKNFVDQSTSVDFIEEVFEQLKLELKFDKFKLFHDFLEFCLEEHRPLRTFYEGDESPNKLDSEKIYSREKHKVYVEDLGRRLEEDKQVNSLPRNPYKGLSTFTSDDTGDFYGRDDEIKTICRRLKTSSFLALTGASGSGKSSLMLAGVIPKLELEKWLCFVIRPDDGKSRNPILILATKLVKAYFQDGSPSGHADEVTRITKQLQDASSRLNSFWPLISQVKKEDQKLLIYIDQFEELFSGSVSKEDSKQFIGLLADFYQKTKSNDTINIAFVVSMRSDFMIEVNKSSSLIPLFNIEHALTIVPPSSEQIIEAIEKPASNEGVTYQNGVVDQITKDIEVSTISLSLVQFSLKALWEKQTDKGEITHEHYLDIGGVGGAFSDEIDKWFKDILTDKEQEKVEHIFINLVGRNDEKWNVKKTARLDTFKSDEQQLIYKLSKSEFRLLILDGEKETDTQTVELVHDALISEWKQLHIWIKAHTVFLSWQDTVSTYAAPWLENPANENLLKGDALIIAKQRFDKDGGRLNTLLHDCVGKSIKHEVFSKKLKFSVAAFIIITLSLLSLFSNSLRQDTLVKNKRLLATMSAQLLGDNETRLSILIALEALENNTNPKLRDEVSYRKALSTLKASNGKYIVEKSIKIPELRNMRAYDISNNLQYIAIATEDNHAGIWKLSNNQKLMDLKGIPTIINGINFDKSSNFVTLTSHHEAIGQIWDLNKQELITTLSNQDVNQITLTRDASYYVSSNTDWKSYLGHIKHDGSGSIVLFSTELEDSSLSLNEYGDYFFHVELGKLTKYFLIKDKYQEDSVIVDEHKSKFTISPNQKFIVARGEDDKFRYSSFNNFLSSRKLYELNYPDHINIGKGSVVFNESEDFFAIYEASKVDHSNPLVRANSLHVFFSSNGQYIKSFEVEGWDSVFAARLKIPPASLEIITSAFPLNIYNMKKEVGLNLLSNEIFLAFEKNINLTGVTHTGETLKIAAPKSDSIDILSKINTSPWPLTIPNKYYSIGEWENGSSKISASRDFYYHEGGSLFKEVQVWDVDKQELSNVSRFEPEPFTHDFSISKAANTYSMFSTSDNKIDFRFPIPITAISHDNQWHMYWDYGTSSNLILKNRRTDKEIVFSKESFDNATTVGFSDSSQYLYFIEGNKLILRSLSSPQLFNQEIDFHDNILAVVKFLDVQGNEKVIVYGRKYIELKNIRSGETLFFYMAEESQIASVNLSADNKYIQWLNSDGILQVSPVRNTPEQKIINGYRKLNISPLTVDERKQFSLN